MSKRITSALVAVTAVTALSVAPLGAQSPATKTPSKKTWTAAKTPWGDPDIQGVWTSDSVRGIP